MIYYKAFNKDLTCRGFQFEIGQEYKIEGELEMCKNGFHCCKVLEDCYQFYPRTPNTRICEVEILGKSITQETKTVASHIRIVKEIQYKPHPLEILESTGSVDEFLKSLDQVCGDSISRSRTCTRMTHFVHCDKHTSSITREEWVRRVRIYLRAPDLVGNRNQKAKIVIDLFEFCIKVSKQIKLYPEFQKNVVEKVLELEEVAIQTIYKKEWRSVADRLLKELK